MEDARNEIPPPPPTLDMVADRFSFEPLTWFFVSLLLRLWNWHTHISHVVYSTHSFFSRLCPISFSPSCCAAPARAPSCSHATTTFTCRYFKGSFNARNRSSLKYLLFLSYFFFFSIFLRFVSTLFSELQSVRCNLVSISFFRRRRLLLLIRSLYPFFYFFSCSAPFPLFLSQFLQLLSLSRGLCSDSRLSTVVFRRAEKVAASDAARGAVRCRS